MPQSEKTVKIQVTRADNLEGGFAAYLAPSLTREGTAQVLLNIEATFHAAAANQEDPVHFVIENVMHEVGHALQEFFGREFNEDEVERVVEQYRERYLPEIIPTTEVNIVFIVGQYIASTEKGTVWEFQGVFNTVDDARDACREANYFYFPIEIGKELPHETVIPATIVYPHSEV